MARVSALFKAVIDLGGDAVDNLRSLGYLTEESAQNPSAVKTAQTKYRKALTESPAMRRREAERLVGRLLHLSEASPELTTFLHHGFAVAQHGQRAAAGAASPAASV